MLTVDINLKAMATTQYTNWPFKSMTKFNGRYLGVNENGLYEITGSDDDGQQIDAYIVLAQSDFGIRNQKKIPFIDLGYEAQGNLMIELTPDDGTGQSYLVLSTKTNQQTKRIPVNPRIRGRYWLIKISNMEGCDFSLDSVSVAVITGSGGISRF